eukprot:scaffold1328_cov161-Pinguiococcus_pyrenoidosus.AAC.5
MRSSALGSERGAADQFFASFKRSGDTQIRSRVGSERDASAPRVTHHRLTKARVVDSEASWTP